MTLVQNNFTFYIYNDLRAFQNKNPDGHTVQHFSDISDAISAFEKLPSKWTTALGVQISEHSALDLVQRREGEPVLIADYLRIPDYYGNSKVQELAGRLQAEWNIQWISDYRILNAHPLMYPVPPKLDFLRDPYINGKHLVPDNPRHLISSVSEMYVQGEGWLPTGVVCEAASKCGYNNPHTPKVTLMHVRYADEHGTIRSGDLHPYQYLLLQERTKLMEHDKAATKALAEAVEVFLYITNSSGYKTLFGDHDPSDEKAARRRNTDQIVHMIDTRDTAKLVDAVLYSIKNGLSIAEHEATARELLGRVLSIPENEEQKLPLDLRISSNAVMREFYQLASSSDKTAKSKELVSPETR